MYYLAHPGSIAFNETIEVLDVPGTKWRHQGRFLWVSNAEKDQEPGGGLILLPNGLSMLLALDPVASKYATPVSFGFNSTTPPSGGVADLIQWRYTIEQESKLAGTFAVTLHLESDPYACYGTFGWASIGRVE